MTTVALTVNGRATRTACPDRTHLADFLRDYHHLTGTHLACEHGVCGACTVLVDGKPTRACITFAPACDGRSVTTVEGYGDDEVMAVLRDAFTKHHALQCGFCTPGMLATARDIVLRFPDADEALIRHELAGNLCRCTGYVGIVAAIKAVLVARRATATTSVVACSAPTADAVRGGASFRTFAVDPAFLRTSAPRPDERAQDLERLADKAGWSRVESAFDLPYPATRVWQFMLDLPQVAECLPGVVLTSHAADRVEGHIGIKFGPMSARFNGNARLDRDDDARRGVLKGGGKDSLSNSRASGQVTYLVREVGPNASKVLVDLQYSLQGPLAQFSRSGLVRDFVRRMIADFGGNVGRRMDPSLTAEQRRELAPQKATPLAVLLGVVWERIRGVFSRR